MSAWAAIWFAIDFLPTFDPPKMRKMQRVIGLSSSSALLNQISGQVARRFLLFPEIKID